MAHINYLFSIQQFQQHQIDPNYHPFLTQGFVRADDSFYATALNNVYQTIQVPAPNQALVNRECTVCGNSYGYELDKDSNGCAICHTCQNNAMNSSVTQASLQLVNSARSLTQQQTLAQSADLESVYKLYTTSNVSNDDHLIKVGLVGAESSNATNSAATSSSTANVSVSAHNQKQRSKKPQVNCCCTH